MSLASLTAAELAALNGAHDPVLRHALLGDKLAALIASGNTDIKAAVVPGTNATVLPAPTDIATVVAILAFTTATGAVAAQALLAVTTDYTVAGGQVTLVTNQSANTLLILYRA